MWYCPPDIPHEVSGWGWPVSPAATDSPRYVWSTISRNNTVLLSYICTLLSLFFHSVHDFSQTAPKIDTFKKDFKNYKSVPIITEVASIRIKGSYSTVRWISNLNWWPRVKICTIVGNGPGMFGTVQRVIWGPSKYKDAVWGEGYLLQRYDGVAVDFNRAIA